MEHGNTSREAAADRCRPTNTRTRDVLLHYLEFKYVLTFTCRCCHWKVMVPSSSCTEQTAQETFLAAMLCIPPLGHHISNVSSATLMSVANGITFEVTAQLNMTMTTQTAVAEIQICSSCHQPCTEWTRLTPILNLRGVTRPWYI